MSVHISKNECWLTFQKVNWQAAKLLKTSCDNKHYSYTVETRYLELGYRELLTTSKAQTQIIFP